MGAKASRALTVVAAVLLALAGAGCGPSAVGPTARPSVGSFQEFFATWCPAMQGMLRAIGNPDSGSDSDLSKALDAAIVAADPAAVDLISIQIRRELLAARELAASAATWPQGAEMATQMGRLFAAFDAGIEAKRAAASQGLEAANNQQQAAFEAAGGPAAWTGMIAAARTIPEMGRADAPSCPGV